ncbi:MAG: hypothetical protein ACRD3W_22045, partial [Terriglobales bacterium]
SGIRSIFSRPVVIHGTVTWLTQAAAIFCSSAARELRRRCFRRHSVVSLFPSPAPPILSS